MNLRIGMLGRFTFKGDFATLGYRSTVENSGIFEIVEILSWLEFTRQGKDLRSLYTTAGKSQADLNKDVGNYTSGLVYKLRTPNDAATEYYIPEFLLDGDPITDIVQKSKLAIGIQLGPWDDAAMHAAMVGKIRDVLEYDFGIKTTGDKGATIQLLTLGDVWMTPAEYATYNDGRTYVASSSEAPRIDGTKNLYAEVKRLQAALATSQARNALLEQAIVDIRNGG